MLTSMYAAISGMNANGTSLSVIGDNISNMNTVAFKGSTASFGDVLSSSLSGGTGSSQIGRGVQVTSVAPIFTQGGFQTTANGLDMAVDGDGFFMVDNSTGTRAYTRAGQFSLDTSGNIINPDGLILQGYLADPVSGTISGTLGNLQVATQPIPAAITTTAEISLNLDARATDPGAAFSIAGNVPANFNASTTITVYDSQGGAHPVTAYFEKTAVANIWTVNYVQNDPAVAGGLLRAGGGLAGTGTQTLTFGPTGALTAAAAGGALTFNFGAGVTSPQPIVFDYGFGSNAPATQYAADFSVVSLNPNGNSSGSLKSFNISDQGIITGVFTNGLTNQIGQVALAKFVAPTGLTKQGRNLYSATADSGQAIAGTPNSSGFGKLLSNSLELSNVDLAEELVRMITAQRGFQANSRIVTTTDQLMQELVNLGR